MPPRKKQRKLPRPRPNIPAPARQQTIAAAMRAGAALHTPHTCSNESAPTSHLHRTILRGEWPAARLTLHQGADIRRRDQADQTILNTAAERDDGSNITHLLCCGAEPEPPAAKPEGGPLHVAASKGNKAAITALLAAGIDLNQGDYIGRSALLRAVAHAEMATVSLLLDRGADPNQSDSTGVHPLHLAAERGDAAIMALLLAHGADPDAQDHFGNRPLHRAADEGCADAVAMLLHSGADPAATSRRGETALHIAVRDDDAATIDLLLATGMSTHQRSSSYETALDIANYFNSSYASETLRRHGARQGPQPPQEATS